MQSAPKRRKTGHDKSCVIGGVILLKARPSDGPLDLVGATLLPPQRRTDEGSIPRLWPHRDSVRSMLTFLGDAGEPLRTHLRDFLYVEHIGQGVLGHTPLCASIAVVESLFALAAVKSPNGILALLQAGGCTITCESSGNSVVVCCPPNAELFPPAPPHKWENGQRASRRNPTVAWADGLIATARVARAGATFALAHARIVFDEGLALSEVAQQSMKMCDPNMLSRAMLRSAMHGAIFVPGEATRCITDTDSMLSTGGDSAHWAAALHAPVLKDAAYYNCPPSDVIADGRTRTAPSSFTLLGPEDGVQPRTAAEARRIIRAAFAFAGEDLSISLQANLVEWMRPSRRMIETFATPGAINDGNLAGWIVRAQTATVDDYFASEMDYATPMGTVNLERVCTVALLRQSLGGLKCTHTGWEDLRAAVLAVDEGLCNVPIYAYLDRDGALTGMGSTPAPTSPVAPWSYRVDAGQESPLRFIQLA